MIISTLVIARKDKPRALGVDKIKKCKFALSIIPHLTKNRFRPGPKFRSEDLGPDLNLGQNSGIEYGFQKS